MQGRLDPTALSVHDTVQVLRAAGARHVSEDNVRADIEAGAPTNADGTLNLVHYCAWMVARLSGGRPDARGED